jgi:ABC-type transport system substrate-binding protein
MSLPCKRRPAALLLAALLAGGFVDTRAADPAEPKVLHYAFRVAETGFDPVKLTDLFSRTVTANMFEALVAYDYLARPARIKPLTAEALPEASADFKTWTVRVRPGIYFADDPAFKGQKRELTAQDYVYTIKRFFDPATKAPYAGTMEELAFAGLNELRKKTLAERIPFDYETEVPGLRALDRYTLRFVLDKPRPRFIEDIAGSDILGAVAREVVEAYGENIAAHPVGTGAFRLKQWRRSSLIVLERNPGYRERFYDPRPTMPKARRCWRVSKAGVCRWSTAWKSPSSKKTSHAGCPF